MRDGNENADAVAGIGATTWASISDSEAAGMAATRNNNGGDAVRKAVDAIRRMRISDVMEGSI